MEIIQVGRWTMRLPATVRELSSNTSHPIRWRTMMWLSGMVAWSIAHGLFPCHQMDSRLFGKFVPVELGMCPPFLLSDLYLPYSGAFRVRKNNCSKYLLSARQRRGWMKCFTHFSELPKKPCSKSRGRLIIGLNNSSQRCITLPVRNAHPLDV